MTTNIHYLIAAMAVLLVVIWQYSRQRQMDDRNSLMFRRLLSVVSLDVAAELVSTGFILYAPYSFNVCRMLSNTVFYLFQARLSAAARSRSCSRSLRSPPSASPRRPSILRC